MPTHGWMNRVATLVHNPSALLALVVLRTDASPGKRTAGASNPRFDRQLPSAIHQMLLEVMGEVRVVESGTSARPQSNAASKTAVGPTSLIGEFVEPPGQKWVASDPVD